MTSPAGGDHYQQDIGAPGGPGGPKITTIFDFTAEALEQLAFWLEQRGLHIPVTQILGFNQFTATDSGFSQGLGAESTASTAYTDLGTVGPTISGLSDGRYVVFFGGQLHNNTLGDAAGMSVQVNSTAASDDDAIFANPATSAAFGTGAISASRAIVKTLSNGGNNTLTAKYRAVTGGTATFSRRWMITLRYGN